MCESRTQTPTGPGDATSRRRSILTLGGAALAALAGRISPAEARKNTKKGKKRKNKGSDTTRCKGQVAVCEALLSAICAENLDLCDRESFEDDLLPCCAFLGNCQAAEMMTCATAYFNPND